MHHDQCMRAAARAIFETFCPDEGERGFAEAEAAGSTPYRRAVEAAQLARLYLISDDTRQMPLL